MTRKKNRAQIAFICLLTVVFLSCIIITSTSAWLLRIYTRNSNDSGALTLGSVSLELMANGTKLTGTEIEENGVTTTTYDRPYVVNAGPVSGTTSTRSVNLKVRNVGTIEALLRAKIRVYYINELSQEVNLFINSTPQVMGTGAISAIVSTNSWIKDYAMINVASGYQYLNSLLKPYVQNGSDVAANEIAIVDNIVVPAECSSKQIYIKVDLQAVAYSGNIYKKIYENSPASIATESVTIMGKTKNYWKFSVPDEDFDDIPVKAMPFGVSLPESWTIWQ